MGFEDYHNEVEDERAKERETNPNLLEGTGGGHNDADEDDGFGDKIETIDTGNEEDLDED